MPIFDPDPAVRGAAIRKDLDNLARELRGIGADVEILDRCTHLSHSLAMTVTMRGPLRDAASVAAKIRRIGEETGGAAYGTLLTAEKTGVPEGEYRVALLYQVMKPPRPRKRSRLAA